MRSGVLVIDKPQDITSQGVVSRVRRILGIRRVGHGGTLDPLATGVLPIFVGRATRASEIMLSADKAYIAGFITGTTSDSGDITGNILSRSDTLNLPSEQDIKNILPYFEGEQDQIPPMYSALKRDGKKLYELARAGIEVEREPRHITINSIVYLGKNNDTGEYSIAVDCTKGTYIRTLVEDIGKKLGCGAVMSSLRRTRTGRFSLEQSCTLEQLGEHGSELLLPTDTLFSEYDRINVTAAQESKLRVGNRIRLTDQADRRVRVYSSPVSDSDSDSGEFLLLGDIINGELVTVKSFFEID